MRLGQDIRLSSGGFLVSNTAELSQENKAQSPRTPALTAELEQGWSSRVSRCPEAAVRLCHSFVLPACRDHGKRSSHTHCSSTESSLSALKGGQQRGFSWNASPQPAPRLPRSRLGSGAAPCWIRGFGCLWCGWGWSWRPGHCENTPGNAQGV